MVHVGGANLCVCLTSSSRTYALLAASPMSLGHLIYSGFHSFIYSGFS